MELKLPAEFKAQWLTALRSGRYVQGNGWLKRDNEFCCLGVAFDISGGKWEKVAHHVPGGKQTYMAPSGCTSYLEAGDIAPEILSVLNQPVPDPQGQEGDTMTLQRQLADKNDRQESFTTIADWIEREL